MCHFNCIWVEFSKQTCSAPRMSVIQLFQLKSTHSFHVSQKRILFCCISHLCWWLLLLKPQPWLQQSLVSSGYIIRCVWSYQHVEHWCWNTWKNISQKGIVKPWAFLAFFLLKRLAMKTADQNKSQKQLHHQSQEKLVHACYRFCFVSPEGSMLFLSSNHCRNNQTWHEKSACGDEHQIVTFDLNHLSSKGYPHAFTWTDICLVTGIYWCTKFYWDLTANVKCLFSSWLPRKMNHGCTKINYSNTFINMCSACNSLAHCECWTLLDFGRNQHARMNLILLMMVWSGVDKHFFTLGMWSHLHGDKRLFNRMPTQNKTCVSTSCISIP